MKNQNNNGCGCHNHPAPAPSQPADINMSVCDRNANVLPMLQSYTTKVLKPNISSCCRKNILTQQMMNCEGYKYVIKWDFDLNGQTITVPENCILEFDGGSLKNGTIVGQDTLFINVGDVDIWGDNLTRLGTWREKQGGGIPDKEYDPEHHSGLGRKTLELKGDSNILMQEDFDQDNTIYVVAYDFVLGENITVPANCVLEFDGGSLNNGTLNLNDTYLVGVNQHFFLSDLTVLGTVSNKVITSEWFVMPAEDSYKQFDLIARLSTNSSKVVSIEKGEYYIKNKGENIKFTQSVDFNNSTITLDANGYDDLNIEFTNIGSYTDIPSEDWSDLMDTIVNRETNNSFTEKYKNCFVSIRTDADEFHRKHTGVEPYKQKEFFYIDSEGYINTDYFNDKDKYGNLTTAVYFRCDKESYFKNIFIKIKDLVKTSQDVDYRYIGIRFHHCSNLTVSNVNVISTELAYDNAYVTYIRFQHQYNVKYNDSYLIPPIALNPDERHSSYSVGMNTVIDVVFNNIRIGNVLEKDNWHCFGCNYITNWTLRDCSFSGIDTHYRLNNLYLDNCVIGAYSIAVSGYGQMTVRNCTYKTVVLLSPRSDYGAFWDGDISIDGCSMLTNETYVSNESIIYVANAKLYGDHDYISTSSRTTRFIGRNINVSDLTVIVPEGYNKILLRVFYVNSSMENTVVGQMYYSPAFNIRNLKANKPIRLAYVMQPYYDSYFKNEANFVFEGIEFDKYYATLENYYIRDGKDLLDVHNDNSIGTNITFTNCTGIQVRFPYVNCTVKIYNSVLGNIEGSEYKIFEGGELKGTVYQDVDLFVYDSIAKFDESSYYGDTMPKSEKNNQIKLYNCYFDFEDLDLEDSEKGEANKEFIVSFLNYRAARGGCFFINNYTYQIELYNCTISPKCLTIPLYNGIYAKSPYMVGGNMTYVNGYSYTTADGRIAVWVGNLSDGYWADSYGYTNAVVKGNTRPDNLDINRDIGHEFFDTLINAPIFYCCINYNRIVNHILNTGESVCIQNVLSENSIYCLDNRNGSNVKSQSIVFGFAKNSNPTDEDILVVFDNTDGNFIGVDTSIYPYIYIKNNASFKRVTNIYNVREWTETDGATAGVARSGLSENRPVGSDIYVGFMYMDVTLGKPIYVKEINGDTVTWVDSAGEPIDPAEEPQL